MHKMWTIAVDVLGVCQSVCDVASCNFTVQMWLNGLRSCFRSRLGDIRNIVLDVRSRILHGFDAVFTKLLWSLVFCHRLARLSCVKCHKTSSIVLCVCIVVGDYERRQCLVVSKGCDRFSDTVVLVQSGKYPVTSLLYCC